MEAAPTQPPARRRHPGGAPPRRARRLRRSDRRRLERAGWRTLLEYREDHVRSEDGTLLAVRRRWVAEAEHVSGALLVCEVVDEPPYVAWSRLYREAARRPHGELARGR